MTLHDRLRMLREELRLSKRGLVAALPVNYSTYANYESGLREPNAEALKLLARHFGVSTDFLLGVTDNRRRADELAAFDDAGFAHLKQYQALDAHGRELVDLVMQKEAERAFTHGGGCAPVPAAFWDAAPSAASVTLPVLALRQSAALGDYLNGEAPLYAGTKRFAATPASLRADFALPVPGDAMEPRLNDGDYAFVKAAPQVEPGDIGLFVYDGEPFLRRLCVDRAARAVRLEPINPAYASVTVTQPERLRTLGPVVGAARREEDAL